MSVTSLRLRPWRESAVGAKSIGMRMALAPGSGTAERGSKNRPRSQKNLCGNARLRNKNGYSKSMEKLTKNEVLCRADREQCATYSSDAERRFCGGAGNPGG